MAIRTFNSVGGFSVGETPETIILANGDITTDFGTFTSNVSAGNLLTDHLLYANGQPWSFITAGGVNTQIQYNLNGALGGSGNFTYNDSTKLLTLTGNARIGNISTTGTIVSDGNISAPNFIGGNLIGNISGNIQVPGSNTSILFNDDTLANSSTAFTFNKTTNVVTVTGNVTSQNANLGNLVTANYFTGTLTTGAQPNITSVGTLTSLDVTGNANTGNVYTGNLSLTGQVLTSVIPSNDNTYNLGNSSYYWKNVYVSSNVVFSTSASLYAVGNVLQTDALRTANNISAGTFTSRGDADLQGNVTISGNLTVGGTTTYINVTNLAVNDPLISLGGTSNGGNASSYDGKDRGLWLRNYYANGSAPVNQFIGWDTSNNEFAIGSDVSQSGEVITFNEFGNLRGNVALFTTLSGTLSTAAQPNVTSLGTITDLTISGNLQVNTKANIANLVAANLKYPLVDGSAGQFLRTDGSGNLSWQTVSTSSIANGSSNVNVQQDSNVQVVVAGTSVANFTSTGVNVAGTFNSTGIATVGYLTVGNSTVRSATVTTTSTTPTTLVSLSGASVRGVEYFIKGEDSTGGKYSVATVSAVHNGTSADYATYGTVNLGGSTGSLSVAYSLGAVVLSVTPSSSNSTVWTVQYRTI